MIKRFKRSKGINCYKSSEKMYKDSLKFLLIILKSINKTFLKEHLNSPTQPLANLVIFKFIKNQFTYIKGFGIKRKLYAKYTLVKLINLAER